MVDFTQGERGSLARFRKEFAALQGSNAFPWQEELFLQFCSIKMPFPSALDLPTGLGKTSVMAIWLMARALAPEARRQKIPRRLFYVVDRRAVVDQATTEAEKLRIWLDGTAADLKPRLNLLDQPLPISTLRGQRADNREWLENPAACAIVVGTVDMIGSRLLFSGYGISPNMRPYHAGFIGADALVVLDEAHLVPAFEALLKKIECGPHHEFRSKSEEDQEIVPAFRLMSLSATGGRAHEPGRVFRLTDGDYKHPVVRQRFNAPKHLTIDDEPTNDTLTERLAARAWDLATVPQPARVLVYCNSRHDALKVWGGIHERAGRKTEPAIGLLVGERRVYERDTLYGWLKRNSFIGPAAGPPDAPTFLVATSAGEVGIDLDADHMVCDLVEWERMVQRFGRVNRRGHKEARIEVIAAPPKDQKKDTEDWNERLARLRAPLDELPATADGSRSASPGAIAALRADERRKALLQKAQSREPLRPALTRALVEAWSMTSLEQHTGRPDIKPWLRGWEEDEPSRSTIAWRKFLPLRNGEKPSNEDINEFFEAAPLHLSEMLEAQTWRAVDWIIARAVASARAARRSKDGHIRGMPGENGIALLVLDRKGRFERAYTLVQLAEFERKENKKQRETFSQRLADRMLVVSSRLGGLDASGMLSHGTDEEASTIDNEEDWTEVLPFRVRETTQSSSTRDENWCEFYRFATERSEDGTEIRWIVAEQRRSLGQTEDSLGVARNAQLLTEHHHQAALAAGELARALGLPAIYAEMLVVAAKLHDEGKKAPRWQRAFHAPAQEIYAKTKGPVNVRLLDGYRHEFGSVLCAARNAEFATLRPDLQDLALHLIAAHHGNSRPLISTRSCEGAPPSALKDKACEVALRFGRLQKQWGPWGLAWWEALLRSVDQQVSRDNDASAKATSGKLKVEEKV
jgi:CRISPR-associated endonuclease/helicase Cas3